MLIVTAHNRGGTDESAIYEVNVYINKRIIWRGVVKGHNRTDGWHDLLHMIAKAGEEEPNHDTTKDR